MIYNRRGRAVSFGDLDMTRLGRVAPQFGDMEGIFSAIKGAAKTVGRTVSKTATTVVHTGEAAGKLPFQAANKVAQSGVRLVSGIAKETGKLGGTILAAPVRVSIEATKGVVGGAKGTIGKLGNIFKLGGGSSSPATDTQKAAAEVAASQGLDPGTGAAPPSSALTPTSSSLSTTGAAGSDATFDVAAAQRALASGATPAEAAQAGEDAAAAKSGGMSTTMKIALAGGAAAALFIGYRMLRRRGGGRTKS